MKFLPLFLLLLLGPVLADQGMTSQTHAAHVGEIVFSNKEIKFRQEDPAALKGQFKLGEPIYGRLYFKQSMANTPLFHTQLGESLSGGYREGAWEIQLFVDGVNQNIAFGNFTDGKVSEKAEREWTTWQINLFPDNPELADRNVTEPWTKVAARLKPGNHEVKLVFNATQGQYKSKPMAVGSFQLQVDEGSSFSAGAFPSNTYTGSDLNQLKSAMKQALVGPVTKNPSDIVDVSVTSNWDHGRYTDTLVEYRKIQGTVLWADTDGDGVLRYTSYSFIQTKTSNGWSTLKFKAFVNGGPEGNYKP